MPTTSQYFSDLQLPTIFGDETTYGTILNTFVDGLAAKVADLNTRLATATTQLGDNSTSGSILHGINQLNTLNAQVAANSPALVASNVLTGTETNIITSPDQFNGDRSTTSSFPVVPNASGTTANVLSALSPPTTEAEILAFDYVSFYNALAPVVADLATRVSQVEADIASARANICKAKKYVDAHNAGGTTVRTSETVFFTVNGIGQFLNTASYDYHSSSYSSGNLTVNYTLNASTNGVTAGQTAAEAHQTFVTQGMLANGSATTVYANEGAAQSGLNLNDIYMHKYNGSLFPLTTSSGTVLSNTYQVTWYPTSSTYQLSVTAPAQSSFSSWNSNLSLFSIRKRKVTETIVYTTPDVSSCDSSPGGPHFTSGSYL